jgi:hypothetical protein
VPRSWYARIKTFLLDQGYVMESVDKTLFTLKHINDFLLVQIYVDDIIFGGCSTPGVTVAVIVYLQCFYMVSYSENLIQVSFKFKFGSCLIFLFSPNYHLQRNFKSLNTSESI